MQRVRMANAIQRREKYALGTKRKNTCKLCNSVASVKVLPFASKHQKSCYSSYGLYYTYRKTRYEAGDMKPDSNEEKPVTVDSREFIF